MDKVGIAVSLGEEKGREVIRTIIHYFLSDYVDYNDTVDVSFNPTASHLINSHLLFLLLLYPYALNTDSLNSNATN